MNKSNKQLNSVVSSLGMLAIIALAFIALPGGASADRAGVVTPYGATDFNNNISPYSGYNSYQGPNSNYVPTSNNNSPTVNTTTSNTSRGEVEGASTQRTVTTTTEKNTEEKSDLAANASFGSNGFMPSGLLQWIVFAIMILLIVILIRKIFGGEKRYHSTPLKHA